MRKRHPWIHVFARKASNRRVRVPKGLQIVPPRALLSGDLFKLLQKPTGEGRPRPLLGISPPHADHFGHQSLPKSAPNYPNRHRINEKDHPRVIIVAKTPMNPFGRLESPTDRCGHHFWRRFGEPSGHHFVGFLEPFGTLRGEILVFDKTDYCENVC